MKIIISASYGGCGSEINKYIAQPRAGRTANSQVTNVVAIMTIRIAFTLRYLAMNRFYRKRCMFDDSLFFSHSPQEYVLSSFSVLGTGQGRGTEIPGEQSHADA